MRRCWLQYGACRRTEPLAGRRRLARSRLFVTRRIPDAGLQRLAGECEVDLWPRELAPAYEILKAKAAACDLLLTLPSVVFATHIGSATVKARDAMAEIAADNPLDILADRARRAWVNSEVAPRRRTLRSPRPAWTNQNRLTEE